MNSISIVEMKRKILINWSMYRFLQLCSSLSLEWLIYFENIVRSILNKCVFGVYSWMHV
jgi:hypothetical protein